MTTPDSPLPVAHTPQPSQRATGGASSVSPRTEDAPTSTEVRTLNFAAAGHTIYGNTRAINFVADLIDQQEREIRLLRRRLADAQDDLAEVRRAFAGAEK